MDFTEQIQEIASHVNGITRKAANRHNISFAQAQFLLKMPSDTISMSEIARHLGIDISTMSRNVNKLEKLDLIIRAKDLYDKRSYSLSLTPHGVEVVDLLYAEIDSTASDILSTIPLHIQKNMADILEQLNWSFIQHREK